MNSVISNLDGLKRLQRNAERLHGTQQVRLDELFTADFMQEHTRFASIDDMFEASHFNVTTAEDFKAIPAEQLDAYVSEQTDFSSWQQMLSSAATKKIAGDLFR